MLNTPTKSPQRKRQEGQAIVLIALLILVLFGMLGLAIDSGRSYVDRRDQQAAVDAAALAAGDYYDNYPDYPDVAAVTLPAARQVYESNLHLYGGPTSHATTTARVGLNNSVVQDTWVDTFGGGYTLTIVASNTLFNGYQFVFTSTHQFPLAFMQIFGGPPNVTINATASSIVGNQRQTPALLTLSSQNCATNLSGNGSLTVLGDVYTNGTACVDSALHLAGNCYGAAGSTCSLADYYCYSSNPGAVPYAPHPGCDGTDIQGAPVVPAPSLPDPSYLATSVPLYNFAGRFLDRGSYTEMTPGYYNSFALTGGDGCYFLDAGVYTWNGGYSSHGGMVSNELKAPNEELWSQPGTTAGAVSPFWSAGGCEGNFTVTNAAADQTITLGPACTDLSPPAPAGCHSGVSDTLSRNNKWGVELTSVRNDTFLDYAISNICKATLIPPGCRRESAPSACQLTPNPVGGGLHSPSNIGISINITENAPGAQRYNVYLNPYGCDGIQANFGWVGRFDAPGFSGGVGVGPYPNGSPWTLGAAAPGVPPAAGASIYDLNDRMIPNPSTQCFALTRSLNCAPPDDETKPQCFSSCPPSPSTPQENAAMDLQYPPYTGGDVANENYCVVSLIPGDANAPCTTARVTPGAVQFYFPNNSCFDQNGGGYTHAFSGEQYNWIIIYSPPGASCSTVDKLNGNAFTQYIGTIYTPSANWDILGTDKAPLAGQVICYTASVTGNGSAGIDFNPNYAPAPPAARLIN